MSNVSSGQERKRILSPSWDHSGYVSRYPFSVSLVNPSPSTPRVQISSCSYSFPPKPLEKTNVSPAPLRCTPSSFSDEIYNVAISPVSKFIS